MYRWRLLHSRRWRMHNHIRALGRRRLLRRYSSWWHFSESKSGDFPDLV